MIKRRKNPDNEVRIELLRELYKKDLEKVLWMLYNPTKFCEECGLDWDSLSCSCRNCQYDELDNEDQMINEPCGNVCVCVCDYFDGEPTDKQVKNFIEELARNELTSLEIRYYYNFNRINAKFIRSLTFLINIYYRNNDAYGIETINNSISEEAFNIIQFIETWYPIDDFSNKITNSLIFERNIIKNNFSIKHGLIELNKIIFIIINRYLPENLIKEIIKKLNILSLSNSDIIDFFGKKRTEIMMQELIKYPYLKEADVYKLKSLQEAIES